MTSSIDVINWGTFEPILEQARQQTGEDLVAVFGVMNYEQEFYTYHVQPLRFSSKAMVEAEGKFRSSFYEIRTKETGVARLSIAWIPDSDRAEYEFLGWIRPQILIRTNTTNKVKANDTECPSESYFGQGELIEEEDVCELDEIVVTAPPHDPGGGEDPEPDWTWPNDPYDPGQGGGGGDGEDNDFNCYPPDYCEEPEEDFCELNPTADVCVNPCLQIEQLEQNGTFRNNMSTLKANATSKNYETGYLLTGLVANAGYAYTNVQGSPNQPFINLSLNSLNIDGYVHSHYQGTFSTFSGQDIRAIYQIYQSGKMNSLQTFMAGVVTATGTSYLMKIEDTNAFLSFAQLHFQNDVTFQNFEASYLISLNGYSGIYGPVKGSELALLELLKVNNAGIKVFKGNADFTAWQAIQVNAANTQIEEISCN